MKVLLVDDEQDFRETLAKRLGRRGIEAATAGSALVADPAPRSTAICR